MATTIPDWAVTPAPDQEIVPDWAQAPAALPPVDLSTPPDIETQTEPVPAPKTPVIAPSDFSLVPNPAAVPRSSEELGAQNVFSQQSAEKQLQIKSGLTPEQFAQSRTKRDLESEAAALDSNNPAIKTPLGAFGVELLNRAHGFAFTPSKSALDEILPDATVERKDGILTGIGKSAYNLALGIPKFATSPIGVATAGLGYIVKPAIIAGTFGALMLKSLGEQIVNTYQNWDQMSSGQQAAAVTDMVGTGAFAGFLGAGAARGTPVITKLMTKSIVEQYPPEQLRGILDRVANNTATPDEVGLAQFINTSLRPAGQPSQTGAALRRGVNITTQTPVLDYDWLSKFLDLPKKSKTISLGGENPNATSRIASPAGVSQPEVRPRLGEETQIRQPGTVAPAQPAGQPQGGPTPAPDVPVQGPVNVYRVVGEDGKVYGGSTEQINQWIKDGRVDASTRLMPPKTVTWMPVGAHPDFAESLKPSATPPSETVKAPPAAEIPIAPALGEQSKAAGVESPIGETKNVPESSKVSRVEPSTATPAQSPSSPEIPAQFKAESDQIIKNYLESKISISELREQQSELAKKILSNRTSATGPIAEKPVAVENQVAIPPAQSEPSQPQKLPSSTLVQNKVSALTGKKLKAQKEAMAKVKRETITPTEDSIIGKNAAGEPLRKRSDGSIYRLRFDRKDKPNGYPDFGGDLAQAPAKLPTAQELIAMTPDEMVAWKRALPYGPDDAARIAVNIDPSHLPALVRARDDARTHVATANASGDIEQVMAAQPMQLKAQTINEVIDEVRKKAPAPVTPTQSQEIIKGIEVHSGPEGQTLSVKGKVVANVQHVTSEQLQSVLNANGRSSASAAGMDGFWMPKQGDALGTIYINTDYHAANPEARLPILTHEKTHMLDDAGLITADQMRQIAEKYGKIIIQTPTGPMSLADEVRQRYADAGIKLSPDDLMREIFANIFQHWHETGTAPKTGWIRRAFDNILAFLNYVSRGVIGNPTAGRSARDILAGKFKEKPAAKSIHPSASVTNNGPEIPVTPAIRNPSTGEIFTGIVHAEAHEKATEAGIADQSKFESGFVTSSGRFVDSDEAYKMALAAKLFKESEYKKIIKSNWGDEGFPYGLEASAFEEAKAAATSPAASIAKGDTAAEKRQYLADELVQQIERNKKDREAQITVRDFENDEGDKSIIVGHKELDDQWSIYEHEGKWVGENQNGSFLSGKSKDELIAEAKDRVRDDLKDQRGTFGADMDNQYEVGPLFEHFDVPEGMENLGWGRTKWGSWYAPVEYYDRNGDLKTFKLSVRDHDASRKDMGLPDRSAEVSKNWSPHEIANALTELEQWLVNQKTKGIAIDPTGSASVAKNPQTETPEFRAWFAGSRVVDSEGNPLVVYHGTDVGDYSTFATPAYFSENPSEASAYSNAATLRWSEKLLEKYKGKQANGSLDGKRVNTVGIMSDIPSSEIGVVWHTDNGVVERTKSGFNIYTDVVEKPNSFNLQDGTIELTTGKSNALDEALSGVEESIANAQKKTGGTGSGGRVYPVYLSIKNPKKLNPLQGNIFAKRLGAGPAEAKYIEQLKSEGYDGIETTSDEAAMFPEIADEFGSGIRQFVPFYQTQIKSAIGNSGAFSPQNPDIRASVAKEPTSKRAQVGGVPRIGQVRPDESIGEVLERVRTDGFDSREKISDAKTEYAWKIFNGLTDPQVRGVEAQRIKNALGGSEMALGLLQGELRNYALKMAAGGDPSLFLALLNSSDSFVTSLMGSDTTAGRVLRAAREFATTPAMQALSEAMTGEKDRAAASEMKIKLSNYDALKLALDGLNLTPEEVDAVVATGKTPDGKTLDDILEENDVNAREVQSILDKYQRSQTEWLKPDVKKSIIRIIVDSAIGENKLARYDEVDFRDRLSQRLQEVEVPKEVADELAFEVWKDKNTREATKTDKALKAEANFEQSRAEAILNKLQSDQTEQFGATRRSKVADLIKNFYRSPFDDTSVASLEKNLVAEGIKPETAKALAYEAGHRKLVLDANAKLKVNTEVTNLAQDIAEKKLAELEQKHSGVEWMKDPSKREEVQRIITDALKIGEGSAPVGSNRLENVQATAKKLIDAGVDEATAHDLALEIETERATTFANQRVKSMERAAKSKSLKSLTESILSSSYRMRYDPKWRHETAVRWFESNGLSREQAEAAAGLYFKEFYKAYMDAARKIVEKELQNAPPKTTNDVISAIHKGLLDPSFSWSDKFAELSGWKKPTKEQFKALMDLDEKLADPSLSPAEVANIHGQMMRIVWQLGKRDGQFAKGMAERFVGGLLSGIRTFTVQFAPAIQTARDLAIASISDPKNARAFARSLLDSAKHNIVSEAKYAWQHDAYKFHLGELDLTHSQLDRIWQEADLIYKNPASTPLQKAWARTRQLYAINRFVFKVLNTMDNTMMAAMQPWKLAYYGSMAFKEAGIANGRIDELVDAMALARQNSYEKAKAAGLDDLTARVRANSEAVQAVQDFIANRTGSDTIANRVIKSAENDLYLSVGRRGTGISEQDEGLLSRAFPNDFMAFLSSMRNQGGAKSLLATALFGFVNIPYRTVRYASAFSPYGLLRYGIDRWRTNQGKETYWKQSFGNEYQARARLREAVAGSVLLALATAWAAGSSSADDKAGDDEAGLYITGSGPTNKNLRDAWKKRGFRPYALNFVFGGHIVSIPVTRIGEMIMFPFMIPAAMDDAAWKNKEQTAAGKPLNNQLGVYGSSMVGTALSMMGQAGIFQTVGQLTQSVQQGDSYVKAASKLGASVASATVLPLKQLLASLSDIAIGKLDQSSVSALVAANFPIVGIPWQTRAINRLGDPLGDRSWYGIIADTGVPVAFQMTHSQSNEKLYTMMVKKGIAPPDLKRGTVEEKYGVLTDQQFAQFAAKSGADLKAEVLNNFSSLKNMSAEDAKKFMSKSASTADANAAAAVGLASQTPTAQASAPAKSRQASGPARRSGLVSRKIRAFKPKLRKLARLHRTKIKAFSSKLRSIYGGKRSAFG